MHRPRRSVDQRASRCRTEAYHRAALGHRLPRLCDRPPQGALTLTRFVDHQLTSEHTRPRAARDCGSAPRSAGCVNIRLDAAMSCPSRPRCSQTRGGLSWAEEHDACVVDEPVDYGGAARFLAKARTESTHLCVRTFLPSYVRTNVPGSGRRWRQCGRDLGAPPFREGGPSQWDWTLRRRGPRGQSPADGWWPAVSRRMGFMAAQRTPSGSVRPGPAPISCLSELAPRG